MSTDSIQALAKAAQFIAARAESGRSLNERELVTSFFSNGFFAALGYSEVGEDVRLELRVAKRKRADVVLRSFTGRPVGLIEFKRPNIELAQHVAQLQEYSADLLPAVALLTNGQALWLFDVKEGQLEQPARELELASLTEQEADFLYQRLYRREVDWQQLGEVRRALQRCRDSAMPITSPSEAGGRLFLQQFGLTERSPFGRLTRALAESLPYLISHSIFAEGAYEFWKQAYARTLNQKDAPESWQPLIVNQKDALYRFMFALESAYIFLSRAMLVKAMSDADFPYLNGIDAFQRKLEGLHKRESLALTDYLQAAQATFEEAARQVFGSLFASDIFDWWQDAHLLPQPEKLCESMAEAVVAIFDFDFSGLSGDLLGALYQSYFDPETRKALGEFYTPPEVAEFILDQVGYRGREIRYRRLLDPSCGSGTFLIHALRRYLAASEGFSATDTLRRLVDDLYIVGFDVNPFAVLMAQANYAALILPLYSQAVRENPHFELSALPVFRTDSLRKELEEKQEEQKGQQGFVFHHKGGVQYIRTELPIRDQRRKFLRIDIPILSYDQTWEEGLVSNVRDYFTLLRTTFSAIREEQTQARQLTNRFQRASLKQPEALAAYVRTVVTETERTLKMLREEYQDGRFLQTIEDLVLAILLKNSEEFRFDYVVGNPPYVRIQHIPELQRNYWSNLYQWAEGSFDIFIPFFERTITEWLKEGGKVGFICSNRFMLANYAANMREQLPAYADIELLFDMRDNKIFSDALNYPAIITAQRTTEPTQKPFIVARAFAEPKGGTNNALAELSQLLAQAAEHRYVKNTSIDAFSETPQHLQREAWHLMPQHERQVFEALNEAGTHRLEELTLTRSGGFQGWSTSKDDLLVLRMVSDDGGDTLTVVPKGGGQAVQLERALLRPWLFGRDVERWQINWNGWYVFFPYFQLDERYVLIPSTDYRHKYDKRLAYAARADYAGPFIDQDYPLAWQYLKAHEKALRNRENGRFKAGKRDADLWYSATYPRSIDLYDLPKLVIQLASQTPDIAFDQTDGYVFQAGGRGGGVYGVILSEKIDVWFALSLLNSKPLDFYLKHTSTVYTGHSYSYSDKFIKNLPIRLPQTEGEEEIAAKLAELARTLSNAKGQLRALEAQQGDFPAPLLPQLGRIELFSFDELIAGSAKSATIKVKDVQFKQHHGQSLMEFGRSSLILPSQAHADLTQRWLHLQARSSISSKDLLSLTVPADATACQKLLEAEQRQENESKQLTASIQHAERQVNTLVANLYNLDQAALAVIDDFLQRF